jgi:hypothetical protein
MDVDVVLANQSIEVEVSNPNNPIVEVSNYGSPGAGIEDGGTTGQALVKSSNTNYDTEWASHNGIAGKQGGTTGEYYHLTSAQHTVVGNTSGTNTGDEVVATGAEVNAGTDNDKMVTPKDMEDSSYAKTSDLPVGGTPNLTLGITNSAGSASSFVKTDATILAFDVNVPSTQAFGDSASAGSATVAARRDHKHAMPAAEKDTTAVTGILKGNGTAISAASAGTDYQAPLSKATGAELKATTDDTKFATAKALDDAGISNWLINQVFA